MAHGSELLVVRSFGLVSENCTAVVVSSSIAKMWCYAVLVGAVHNDSTVSVVSFDIAGTLKQKSASTAPTPKRRFDE